MLAYIVRRLAAMPATLLIASFVIFGVMQLVPGDPVIAMFFPNVPPPERVEVIREQLGLNKPFLIRYVTWLLSVVRGDLGKSFKQGRPVAEILRLCVPPTVELAIAGIVVSMVVGLIAGVWAGVTRSAIVDNLVMIVALLGVSIPSFWLGLLLILAFSLGLNWFPTSGVGGVSRLVLPALTLGLFGAGSLARLTRSSVLEVRFQEYVMTARSKGLSEWTVCVRHILRNALIPVVTMLGMLVGAMLGGAVIVETVFGRTGIGQQLVRAITDKDFPLVQGLLLFIVSIFVLVNLVVDLSYAYIDPRIRYD